MKDGKPLNGVYLQPKVNLFFKDLWLCPTRSEALDLVAKIAAFDEINHVEFKGKWVWADFLLPPLSDFLLPGQPTDDRSKVHGR